MSFKSYKPGDRIRMLHCADEYHPIPSGTMGTVVGGCEQLNMLYVDWDNGRTLNVCLDVDVIEHDV